MPTIDKFFMVLTLIGLRPDLEIVRDQILGTSSVPSLDDVFARLLRISSTQTLPSDNTSDSFVLVSQTNSRGGRSGNRGRGQRPHCTYCNKLGHTRDRCYQLHGQPPRTAHDRSTGKTIGIGRESQGLYHLTSPSTPAVCISTDAPLLIHSRLGHPSLSKFQKMDKLSAKATKCIFLGYSRLQKGYRCYSSETHRYFLSADVTFFEDSPFFSTSESLPVSEVLPLSIIFPPDAVPSHPLQVYHRSHRVAVPPSLAEVPVDSLPIPSASPAPALPPSIDLPITLRKGWRQAMVDEMIALHSNGTWDLVVLPSGKFTVGCRWVYTVKVGPDGQIASIRLLLSMTAMRSWPLYQLDIKNAFLHGDLVEEVYMEQPPGFVAQGESGLVCRLRRSLYGETSLEYGLAVLVLLFRSLACSSVPQTILFSIIITLRGQCIYLVVYVDDIVITDSDQNGIQKLKQHFFTHFQTKDLGKLKYFLGIEIAQSSSGVVLSQRKYALDILEETGMLDCKSVDTPMDPNVKLILRQGEPLGDPGRYRDFHWDAVIRILRYIKSTPGQGVLYENRGHTQVVGYTDTNWADSPTDRRSTSGYCVFIGGNLISWKSKKQDVVTRSSAEASIEL
ncbi:Retrovirus-related Pol polyprotein from transposon RE2 [Vitis vinifera]|uniref:Retrovirus-related Pol polyprotein from transposon RE2 n=1 Tax=Vitis vinifera TaxID=29760 RepID=A0A438GCU4_VITVI|nr:Retrovirus-related Pol polyprotein from transposon RE2 [Vitis vinifera]